MQKIISVFFLILFFFITLNSRAYAYDKEVVCGESCNGFSGALFSENDIKPGDSINKTLSIKNDRNEDLKTSLSSEKLSDTDDILADRITIIIYDGGTILFSGTFTQFLGQDIDLGSILQNNTKVFDIHTAFPHDAGNVYQDKKVNFSLTLRIEGIDSGNEEVLSTSTTTSSSGSSDSSSSGSYRDSLIGQVLGLSDTGGVVFKLFYALAGLIMVSLGLRIIRKYSTPGG